MAEETKINNVYHERQKLQFCLLHSLNNLFQEKDAFTRADLNSISEKLVLDDPNKEKWSPLSVLFKPHHNPITGNYDINVLISALEERGKTVVWHDRRLGASTINLDGSDDSLMGVVINIPVRRYAALWRSRHWVTLRKIAGVWYNLDSDFVAPLAYKNAGEVEEFLDGVIAAGGEVLLVRNGDQRSQAAASSSQASAPLDKAFEELKQYKIASGFLFSEQIKCSCSQVP